MKKTNKVMWAGRPVLVRSGSKAIINAYRQWRRSQRVLAKAKRAHKQSTLMLLALLRSGKAYLVSKSLMVCARTIHVKRTVHQEHEYSAISCKQLKE